MKNLTKNILSLFLVFTIAATTFITAFAYRANSEDISYFNATFEYDTNNASLIELHVRNYVGLNKLQDPLAFFIYNSNGVVVFDSKINEFKVDFIGYSEDPDFGIFFYIFFSEPLALNPDEEYTFVVNAGALVNEDGIQSPEFSVSFLPSQFIYVPTFWERVSNFFSSIIDFLGTIFVFLSMVKT